MELTFGTGFKCPFCGREASFTTGFWSMFTSGILINKTMERLDREGGKLTSTNCGHSWLVKPGSRSKP